jgi:beta-D-xylosidase 4
MAASKHFHAQAKALLLLMAVHMSSQASSMCTPSDTGSTTAYNVSSRYLGCYQDPHVTILSDAKLSTIIMTPQYCTTWCGKNGFAYGGIEFGT